jgi:glutathione synthase
MRHLFVMDPLESLNRALDSSLRMGFELARLGHEVHACEPRQLAWPSGGTGPTANARRLHFQDSAVEFTIGTPKAIRLKEFQAIHMRKDPPYDMDYIAATWLMEPAMPEAKVYNAPAALRRLNEKLAILRFPEDIHPALVSADPAELLAFVETVCQGDAVLKPLTLFGGRGVMRLKVADSSKEAVRATLAAETADGTRMRLAQPFDPAIFKGEVRVFTAFGEPLAWCLKEPAEGQFLANTRMGAVLKAYTPTQEEEERIRRVAQSLLRDGVTFIGFDLIGGYLSEINLTSPRLLLPPGDTRNPYRTIATMIQRDLGG